MSFLRFVAFAVAVCLPAVSGANGITVLSADRTVYTVLSDRLNGSSDPPPETVVVSDSYGGLGQFDSTVINHRTTPDQQFFTTATASQLSIIDENSVTAFLDADFGYGGPPAPGPWFGGHAESTIDITFHLDQAMRFNFSGVFEVSAANDFGDAFAELSGLDGQLFDFSGTITYGIDPPVTCPGGPGWAQCGPRSSVRYDNTLEESWSIEGLLPEGTYSLFAFSGATWQDSDPGSMLMSFSAAPIPEPSSAILFPLGLGLVGSASRRRRIAAR